MIDLIPTQFRLAAYALACALLFGAGWIAQGYRLGEQIAQIEKDQAQALASAIQQARAEEQRRQIALEGIRKDAQDQIAIAVADAAAADTAAIGLQQQVDRLAARRCPASTAGSTAADPAGDMLALMFRRIDEASGELAKYGDRARIAGDACVKAYRSVE